MPKPYSITREPIYLMTVAAFALITTVIPTMFGQRGIWPLIQSVALTLFMGMTIRHRYFGRATVVLALWLSIQLLLMTLLSYAIPEQVQRVIPDGFNRQAQLLEWFYAGSAQPDALVTAPLARLFEIVALLIGTIVTGGLIGVWILVRTVTLVGFYAGLLLAAVGDVTGIIAAVQPWALLRIAGYAGFVLLLSEPLLTGNMRPSVLLVKRRRLLLIAAGLLLTGLIFEIFLPEIWRTIFQPVILNK